MKATVTKSMYTGNKVTKTQVTSVMDATTRAVSSGAPVTNDGATVSKTRVVNTLFSLLFLLLFIFVTGKFI